LPVNVDLQDTDDALYALATVNGVSGSQIAVAIEDRWLLISGHLGLQVESEGHSASPSEQEARGTAMRWIDWDDLYSVLKGSEEADDLICADHAADPPEAGIPVKSRPFCVVELPMEVDVSRSVAVLSDGLIAIRMPKVRRAACMQVAINT
jgi:HSP20 family molecular chaperone IbpA